TRTQTLQFEEQNRRIAGLNAQVETLLARERDLREMLLEAHDQLLKRDEEIALTLSSTQAQQPRTNNSAPLAGAAAGGKYLRYQQMVAQIRELVRSRIPDGGGVLVISKGDEELVRLDPCKGSHFPQREDGRYSGYYPADGAAALEHLKDLRRTG